MGQDGWMSQRPELTGVELWGPRQDRSGPKGRRLAQVEINELGGASLCFG